MPSYANAPRNRISTVLPDALNRNEEPVWAGEFSHEEWEGLKARSLTDAFAFKMACCNARAVLKTSINGLQFFAHYSDECATAPETVWHIEGKDLVFGALKFFGVKPRSEVPGGTAKDRWKADIYFEIGERKIAIELQRSYQHLRDYVRRQERYARYGVECYWLVRPEAARSLMKSIMNKRWKEEFERKMPPFGHMINTTSAFYFGILTPDKEMSIVSPGLALNHLEFLAHVINNDVHWNGLQWSV
ncbi:hypothetical protein IRZ76_06635 [Pseudomonas pudica]|uniref:Competence protein CoiA nuclease-like domain-containing protein n=1 Tax=Pseudomonas pudica TaxID=272772 RepID=A0ABS0FW80_9PSED|nr:hypothetical protein [Pseudomonas pudica]MBF8759678.1 hypothetical protein [Pseudomonas pudica]